MKRRIPIFVSFFCAFMHMQVCEAEKSATPFLINVGLLAFDVEGENGAVPLRKLSAVLHKQKKPRVFRTSWTEGGPNYSSESTTLYNRTKKTFTLYSVFTMGGFGNENLKPAATHIRFRNVEDWMIHALAKKHVGKESSSQFDSYFAELSRYGCRRVELGRKFEAQLNLKNISASTVEFDRTLCSNFIA